MANELILYGPVLHELVARSQGRPHCYMIIYNIPNRDFKYEPSIKRLLGKYNTVNLIFTLLWPLLTIYVVIGIGIFDSNSGFTASTYFVRIFLDCVSFVVVSLSWSIFKYRQPTTAHLNVLSDYFHRKYEQQAGQQWHETREMTLKNIFNEYITGFMKLLEGHIDDVDVIGLCSLLTIIVVALIPPAYFVCEFVGQFAIFSYLLELMFPKSERSFQSELVLRTLGTCLNTILANEASRILSTVLVGFSWCGKGCYDILTDIKNCDKGILHQIQQYKGLCILQNRLYNLSEELIYATYEAGTLLMTLFMTGITIGWRILPLPICVMCCIALTFMIPGMFLMIHLGLYPNATSTEMIREWKVKIKIGVLPKREKDFYVKTLNSLQPVGFPVKCYGLMSPEFRMKTYTRIISNTQDLILTLSSF